MNEGLEALKRIKPYADSSIRADCELIEKELERLAKIDELLEEIGIDENDLPIWFEMQKQDGKKVKALEIIKNIGILKPYETSGGQCWLETMCDATKITKDNYDLLKEVFS